MRSCRDGRAKDKAQTMISTDVMILATIHRPPPATCHLAHATRHTPPAKHCLLHATCLTPPGAWRLQLSKSLGRACRSIQGSILGGTWERTRRCTWERLESLLGSVQSSRLEVCNPVQSGLYFGMYLGACNEVHLAAWFQVCYMQRDV